MGAAALPFHTPGILAVIIHACTSPVRKTGPDIADIRIQFIQDPVIVVVGIAWFEPPEGRKRLTQAEMLEHIEVGIVIEGVITAPQSYRHPVGFLVM
jgi:hypothetical protein